MVPGRSVVRSNPTSWPPLQGTWNDGSCSCDCLSMYNTSSPGYCPDASGVCTVQKPYNATSRTFICPGAPAQPAASPLHPQATPDTGHGPWVATVSNTPPVAPEHEAPQELAGLQISAPGDAGVRFANAYQAVRTAAAEQTWPA